MLDGGWTRPRGGQGGRLGFHKKRRFWILHLGCIQWAMGGLESTVTSARTATASLVERRGEGVDRRAAHQGPTSLASGWRGRSRNDGLCLSPWSLKSHLIMLCMLCMCRHAQQHVMHMCMCMCMRMHMLHVHVHDMCMCMCMCMTCVRCRCGRCAGPRPARSW